MLYLPLLFISSLWDKFCLYPRSHSAVLKAGLSPSRHCQSKSSKLHYPFRISLMPKATVLCGPEDSDHSVLPKPLFSLGHPDLGLKTLSLLYICGWRELSVFFIPLFLLCLALVLYSIVEHWNFALSETVLERERFDDMT